MSTEARGQLLGYSLQFPRALLRLLEISSGCSVGIEVSGDVSVFFPEGITLSEEDKSSIAGNALTDKSTNLWKTFYNWCHLVQEKDIDVERVRFVLYTNHSVSVDSFVQWLSEAKTIDAINPILDKIHALYKELPTTHDIYPYLDYLLNEGLDIFRGLIPNFELAQHHGTKDLYAEIDNAIRNKIVPDSEIAYVRDELGGWLQREINMKIAAHETPIITFESFRHYMLPLLQKVRTKKLIDFAVNKLPSNVDLENIAKNRPIYVQQLELIDSEASEILEAVSDFYRATTNRQAWIERDYVDEASMNDFQERLQTFHTAEQKRQSIIHKDLSPEEQGKILLYNCKERNELLNDMTPPDRTISGTYHFLANEKSIGWHPNWVNMLKEEEYPADE